MVTKPKPKLTTREMAAILKENGVEVFQCLEPGWINVSQTMYRHHPSIFFKGDENEGQRAVKILQEHGVPVFEVVRRWFYDRRDRWCDVRWELIP